MMNWLRSRKTAALLLTLMRLYVGWTFLKAGWKKLTGERDFDASGFLKGAVAKSEGQNPVVQGWYGDYLESTVLPNVELVNFLVPWGELLVGAGLMLGIFTTFAALIGALMNFSFLFAGAISVNPNLILLEFFLLAAGFNAGRFGGDNWVIPVVRTYWDRAVTKRFRNESNQVHIN